MSIEKDARAEARRRYDTYDDRWAFKEGAKWAASRPVTKVWPDGDKEKYALVTDEMVEKAARALEEYERPYWFNEFREAARAALEAALGATQGGNDE